MKGIFLLLLWCVAASANASGILDTVSPKLKQFLKEHPSALRSVTDAITEVSTGRNFELYYFYSQDESAARASHYYREHSVGILLRENQEAPDEFICLLFEILNSQSENRFKDIIARAQSGALSKPDFAQQMLKVEFEAVKKTKKLLISLKFSRREIAKSQYYDQFVRCPDDFKEYVSYSQLVSSPHRDPVREMEAKYDIIRQQK